MRKSAKLMIAGVVGLACAGAVVAAERDVHVLKVALPDGSIEQIHYTGDVAPKVVVLPAPQMAALTDTDFDAPFAMLDRLSAEMEQQHQAMLREVAALQAHPAAAAPARTAAGAQPQGVVQYSYVSTSSGANGCTQSYELTSYAGGQAPKVVSQRSGDCRGVPPLVQTAVTTTPAPTARPVPAAATAKPAPSGISPNSI